MCQIGAILEEKFDALEARPPERLSSKARLCFAVALLLCSLLVAEVERQSGIYEPSICVRVSWWLQRCEGFFLAAPLVLFQRTSNDEELELQPEDCVSIGRQVVS